jgi:hypothetical protein
MHYFARPVRPFAPANVQFAAGGMVKDIYYFA